MKGRKGRAPGDNVGGIVLDGTKLYLNIKTEYHPLHHKQALLAHL